MRWDELLAKVEAAEADHSDMLEALVAIYERYIWFGNVHAPVALALWTVLTHVVDAFTLVPYVHVTSAEPMSGKSRVLQVAQHLVARAWAVIETTEAALFRKITRDRPTLLFDEVDAVFGQRGEFTQMLRGILNAGFQKGVVVPRCSNFGADLVEFEVFGPKMLAGIRDIPDTIASRSIRITLRRRRANEAVMPLREAEVTSALKPVHDALVTWSQEVGLPRLQDPEAPLPGGLPELNDRTNDLWRPLLQIAQLAGDRWVERAEAAAKWLAAADQGATGGVQLLRDIRQVMDELGQEQLRSPVLLDALAELEDSPWAARWSRELGTGNYKAAGSLLAQELRPFGIQTARWREANGAGLHQVRGYRRADFQDVWDRYGVSEADVSDNGDEPVEAVETDAAAVTRV